MPGVFQFSQTAADNADGVPSINWAEGMPPSAVNDSSRAEMAAVACYRDDISGSIVTTGISTAYVLTSNQGFGSSAANLNNQVIAFSPHTTSGAAPNLIVDGIGPFPIQSAPNVNLPAGVLVQGTPYVCIFNSSANAFFLHGYFGNIDIPFLTGMDYWDTIAPGSQYILPAGQAISRTVYARAFARWGTTYGPGDGSTTFNVPDKRGRGSVTLDSLGGTAAGRVTAAGSGISGTTAGATGGSETVTLTPAEIPPVTFSGETGTESANHTHEFTAPAEAGGQTGGGAFSDDDGGTGGETGGQSNAHTHAFSGAINGGGGAHTNMPPCIVVPSYIIRVI
jgi:microcystin-dependent protein